MIKELVIVEVEKEKSVWWEREAKKKELTISEAMRRGRVKAELEVRATRR